MYSYPPSFDRDPYYEATHQALIGNSIIELRRMRCSLDPPNLHKGRRCVPESLLRRACRSSDPLAPSGPGGRQAQPRGRWARQGRAAARNGLAQRAPWTGRRGQASLSRSFIELWDVGHRFNCQISCRMQYKSCLGTPRGQSYYHIWLILY